MHRRAVWAGGAAAALPGTAFAHAFESGADKYAQFLEGASVALATPAILLCLLPVGLLIGLWHRDGMVQAWPLFLGGLAAGLVSAPLVPPAITVAALLVGGAAAALGAVTAQVPRAAALGLAAAGGVTAAAVALEGHGFLDLPWLIYLGIFFGANLLVAVPAGLVVTVLDQLQAAWVRIGVRVILSWTGATAILLSAFELR